jgi:nitroreductase
MASETISRTLPLTPDDLLTTTRAVRKRLDLTRPVEREVIEACLRIAQQAPTGMNSQPWHFVIITDPDKRRALADLYRQVVEALKASGVMAAVQQADDPVHAATQRRVVDSALYLGEHLHEVPVHVIPCISPRPDSGSLYPQQALLFGSIIPAAWSFMLAARARGLGTVWTTLHLEHEEAAARLLDIPYADVAQAALIPVAYTKGTDFKPAPRLPLDCIVHWNTW